MRTSFRAHFGCVWLVGFCLEEVGGLTFQVDFLTFQFPRLACMSIWEVELWKLLPFFGETWKWEKIKQVTILCFGDCWK